MMSPGFGWFRYWKYVGLTRFGPADVHETDNPGLLLLIHDNISQDTKNRMYSLTFFV